MASGIPGKSVRNNEYGIRVDRVTGTLPQTGASAVFTVAGGRVIVTQIVGEVTTIIQTQANATKLKAVATTGGTTDMGTTVDISALAVGAYLSPGANPAAAHTKGTAVGQMGRQVVAPGSISLDCAASNTGSVKWTLFYIPLDDGASVQAA